MRYYVFIKGNKIVDTNQIFLKYQDKHKILLMCDASEASFIIDSKGTVYQADWLNPVPDELKDKYPIITLNPSNDLYVKMIQADQYPTVNSDISSWVAPKQPEVTTTQSAPIPIKKPLDRLNAIEKEQEVLKKAIDALILQNIAKEKES